MAKFKITFYGADDSETPDQGIECYHNGENNISITIGSSDSYDFIDLDKSTAIQFVEALKIEINKIT
tara:strand:+ start:249 stop:449 length:201 start_codon:yes stop_codon:yes gene_type:complete